MLRGQDIRADYQSAFGTSLSSVEDGCVCGVPTERVTRRAVGSVTVPQGG